MPGIYIHIPFCKQACHYCNFHFSTSLRHKEAMLEAILIEITAQKNYLPKVQLNSIYLGGGTPSLLSLKDLERIFNQINKQYSIAPNAEITLEANPDDLTPAKLKELAQTPINRLSIGIQSFSEADLKFMNRAHNAQEAQACIRYAQEAGFSNLTVDLIYGTPSTSHAQWAQNLASVFQYNIPHLSCYCMTVEPNTALDHFIKKGKAQPVNEEHAAQQFEYLLQTIQAQGYEQYEISNFAKNKQYAVHNSNYWLGDAYLGIGPSAHSFNGKSRQWNVAHNAQYINAIKAGKSAFDEEVLSTKQRYNEYVMTALRTIWGCDLKKLEGIDQALATRFQIAIQPYLANETVQQKGTHFYLTTNGKLLADNITMALFEVD